MLNLSLRFSTDIHTTCWCKIGRYCYLLLRAVIRSQFTVYIRNLCKLACGVISLAIPLTFSLYEFLQNLPTFTYLYVTNSYNIANATPPGVSFKASKTARVLGSAMRPDSKGSELRTVTHQNGFRSTITFGVPTFMSYWFTS
ncbi:hypothetical protein SAMN06295916_0545 [Polynucleobacter victoriensis]|uniref:Uncharacterized protein n=1 Tax=Polynucleobacter victoriensis TaxID=2049319 RepID=A0A212T6W3_9BURK|nr:hypothetical protein SAMN06295916_0545 [Polynucleobacter victoriensis]